MAYQLVEQDEVPVGKPLPWDVFDGNKVPLFRRGAIIQKQEQLDALFERGLYRVAAKKAFKEATTKAPIETVITNPFNLIDRAKTALAKVIRSNHSPAAFSFTESIYQICHLIRKACFSNKDAAIASILIKSGPSYAIKHMVDTAIIVEIIMEGMEVGADERLSMMAAALTMNTGMLDLQESIHHRLGSLSSQQKEQIRQHPQASYQMLVEAGVTDRVWLDAVLQHHELLDGSGYPSGLKGEVISQGGRMVCIADVFSAWICPRGDRANVLPNAAMREIFLMRDLRYDKDLSAHLVKHIGIYPAGTLLQLQKGEVAVVIRQGNHVQRPIASVIVDEYEQKVSPIEREVDINSARILPPFRPDMDINPDNVWGYHQ